VTPTALVMPNSRAVVDYVARDPHAIGYVSMGYVTDTVRVLAVEGLVPTPQNVSRAEYNLTRDLVVLSRPDASGAARAFLDFYPQPGRAGYRRPALRPGALGAWAGLTHCT